jgi:hypothetical protein
LGEESTEPSGGLDRPHPIGIEWFGPGQQPVGLMPIRRQRQSCDLVFVAVNRDSFAGRLVRVDPDRDRHECSSKVQRLGRREGRS